MVKDAAQGWDVGAIARWSGWAEATVRRWLAAYHTGGVSALADAPRGGRPLQADAAYLAVMAVAVETDLRRD